MEDGVLLQNTGPGMIRSRWWLNMYELDRDLDRPRPMPSSVGGEDPSCTPELETERLFWNHSRALPSTRSVREGRRLPNCGELDRLSSLFIFSRKWVSRDQQSRARVSVSECLPGFAVSYIRAVATSDSQQHTLCTLSQVTYAHSVRRFSLSPKTAPVHHLYLPRPSDITNIRFSPSLAPLEPPFAPPSPAAQHTFTPTTSSAPLLVRTRVWGGRHEFLVKVDLVFDGTVGPVLSLRP